jgi:ketosteroid isomerase-like protein
MKRILVIAVVLLTVASTAAGRTRAEKKGDVEREAVMRLERELADAFARRDIAALERILADDFTWVDEDGVTKKAQYLKETAKLAATTDSIILDDREVRVYGNTAVSTGRFKWSGDSVTAHYTAVYVKRSGRWQAVAGQFTTRRK